MGKSQRKFTKAMVLTISLTGLISTILLLNDPPASSDVDVTPAIFDMASNRMSQFKDRGIASTDTATAETHNILEVQCTDGDQAFETPSSRLRLKGQNCLSEDATQTAIRNNSNGYIATVFHKPDFSFTTDFINLKEGKNEIDITFETPSGSKNKKVTIQRMPASVKK